MKFKFFAVAKELSKLSNHKVNKHGAVIVKRGVPIALGINRLKTHPKSPPPFNQIHAEMDAILRAKVSLKGAEIYVYREDKDGIPKISKPCIHCMKLIKEAGIKKIFYSINKGFQGEKL